MSQEDVHSGRGLPGVGRPASGSRARIGRVLRWIGSCAALCAAQLTLAAPDAAGSSDAASAPAEAERTVVPSPARAPSEEAPNADALFLDPDVLTLRLEGPIRRVARDRRPDPEEHPFLLSWETAAGDTGAVEIEVRARGKSRRRREVCAFPPLRLDLPRSAVADTLFAHQDKLKLVTHCVPLGSEVASQFEHVGLELLAYRFLGALTDRAFRVRPVRVTYVDPDGAPATHPGFLIEHERRLAHRLGLDVVEADQVPGSVMDAEHRTLVEVFQYLIGNTDFSFHGSADGARCCHNAVQLVDADGVHYPVPYDFDLTGLVNKPDARPARGHGITRVTQRRFVGVCRDPEALTRVLDQVRGRREVLSELLEAQPGLRDAKRRATARFLERFWATLDDPRRVRRAFLERCG